MSDPIRALESLRQQFEQDLVSAGTEADLRTLRDKYLSRKGGLVSVWLKSLGSAPPEDRPRLGQSANELKKHIEDILEARSVEAVLGARPPGAVDVTLPGRAPAIGHRHPLSLLRERIEGIFTRMGFLVIEGPELEDDYHNFEALNMPAEHPARDMQDTLYLASPVRSLAGTAATLLRTHTSGMQIRYMEEHRPPVRLIAPGRVYRRDQFDLTHTPMFTQVEGLVVGEGVSLADLKGTLATFARELFGAEREIRLRPSFFPYTEPSAELDISCAACGGSGCPMCKRTGWIEVLGSGMVHPAVFEAVGYDADRYTGFAFGMGIERIALLKWGVEDIRLFYENDLRFLEQFPAVKIVHEWLRELVGVPDDVEAVASAIALRGFEVASVENGVIDFEITANRPDCLNHLGIAREAAVIWSTPVRQPPTASTAPGGDQSIDVDLQEPTLCPRYCAQVFEATIGPSPSWLVHRLEAAGVRPISNIVDVTNYVMLEIGQPMHAFDLARLGGGRLVIRRARPAEILTTLDGVERRLTPDMLVIADAERATAIGGVMGGSESEIHAGTRRMVLESAYFQPASVRRTSKALNLKTEASTRFERGGDIASPPAGLARAAALFEQIGAGRPIGPAIDRYPSPRAAVSVQLRPSRITRLLGQAVPPESVPALLTPLGFELTPAGDGWQVTVPTWRVDVAREADLVEEVGRHFGFDRIPAAFPQLAAPQPAPGPSLRRDRILRESLTASGFSEAMTFAFIEREAALPYCADGAEPAAIANPLSEKYAVLRPSLLPGLIDACAHNRRRGRKDIRLFETGSRFVPAIGEGRAAAAAWCGAADDGHWSAATRGADFFDIKGVIERLCAIYGVRPDFADVKSPFLAPGRAAEVSADADGTRVPFALIGQLLPSIAAARGFPAAEEIYVAEIDVVALFSCAAGDDFRAESLPRYPSIVRDVSILVSDTLPAATVRGTIRSSAPPTLVSIVEFDRYTGKGVPAEQVSLSLRLTFRAPDRTLTDDEVQAAMSEIVAALRTSHGAEQR